MPTRQELVLAAAVEVLATGGSRPLTHRAVDVAAGLPTGSTSNLFRTRQTLLGAVLDHLADTEMARIAALERDLPADPLTVQELTALAAAMIGFALGPGRTLTLARHAVFAEVAARSDPGSRALDRTTRRLWRVAARRLSAAGSTDPQQHARWLLAYVDGLVTDQLVRPQRAFDATAAVRPFLAGLLNGAG